MTVTAQAAQLSSFNALNYVLAAAGSGGDQFTNDGRTFVLYLNGNASARTGTIAANAGSKPGWGDISAADAQETFTIPGSGTNGGVCVVGPFPQDRFNDANGNVNITYDVVTALTMAVVKLKPYI